MVKALTLVGSARVVSTACQALTLLIVARALAPAAFAEFAAAIGALTALGIVADGGATYALGRHHVSPWRSLQILRAGRILNAATLLVSFPALLTAAGLTGSGVLLACLPLCLWVPLERQLEVHSAYLLALHEQKLVGAGYLLRRVPTAVAVAIFAHSGALIWIYSGSMLATAALVSAIVSRRVARATSSGAVRSDPFQLVGHAHPFLPHPTTWHVLRPFWTAVAGQGIRQIDVTVLTMAAGAGVAGMFAPASRLVPALLLIPGTYTQMLLARLAATNTTLSLRSFLLVAALTTATFAPLAYLADIWVPLLLGPAYRESVPVVRVVVASLIFAALSSYFASGLHARDRAAHVAAAVWLASSLSIASIAVLGSTFGANGAAWGTAAGYVLQCLLMAALYVSRPRRRPQHARQGGRKTWDSETLQQLSRK